jgi:hypothetical protein
MNLEQIRQQDFKKIQKWQGFKNLEDVFDDPTFEELREEIEDLNPQINEQIRFNELSNEQKVLLEKIRTFCVKTSGDFKEQFWYLLQKYREEKQKISQRIIDYLESKSFDLPQFIITHGKRAQDLLRELGFKDYTVSPRSLLVILQLPKPLSQFWWKGGVGSWGDKAQDVTGVIEWGHFYRELMPIIWSNIDYYEEHEGVKIDRINPKAKHEPKKYYYIWQIKEKKI